MQEISSLVKYFIRCANKRGPRLECGELLNHVMEYWCEITQQQWHNLLDLYCGLFTGSSKAIKHVLVSRIIHTAVQGCCLQTEGFSHKLFSFFSRALLNARQERHLAVVEHLVSALNVFLRSAAMNCRMRVCRLGEELLPKEEIVEFFNLQLCVHHPKGSKTQDTGAYAEDWAKWQSLLYNLYDALVSEISQIGSRGKYASESRHIAVKENLIELTADICHQLDGEDSNLQILEGTQAHLRATQRGSPQGTPSKRRRIELGLEVLRDHLQPHHSDFDIIPCCWGSSGGVTGPYMLRCLREVARCQATHPERAQAYRAELGRLCGRVWALSLRGVSSPQTEALSLALLSTVLQGALIPIDREFLKLFSGSACKPSDAAALCLALLKCPVPKSLGTGWDHAGAVKGVGPPSLKIMSWLLMNEQSEEAEERSRPQPIICSAVMQDQAQVKAKDALSEIESMYLQFSFDEMPSDPMSQTTPPECLVRCSSLLTGILAGYVSNGLLTEEEACHSQLFIKAKALAQDFSEYISNVKVNMAEDGTMTTLRSVMRLCTQCVNRGVTDSMSSVSCNLFMKIFPARLLIKLSEICKLLLNSSCKRGSVVIEEEDTG
ncbi:hypothetical protein J4Q44_G00327840 [Coregonus suidteri]|uniref:Uncharacterized protein n=1 Tax=Coregonus suidteri TaxID=861788 RepID=A0AAN8KQ24_9TELE